MRNGGLSKMDALLDIAGTKARLFSNRTGAFEFQDLQDLASSWVGDSMKGAI